MSRHLPDQPSGMYRFERTPSGRRPLARNQAARVLAHEQARLREQFLWSLPLALIVAVGAVFAGSLAGATLTVFTAQAIALAGMLPAAQHLSRWSRLGSRVQVDAD